MLQPWQAGPQGGICKAPKVSATDVVPLPLFNAFVVLADTTSSPGTVKSKSATQPSTDIAVAYTPSPVVARILAGEEVSDTDLRAWLNNQRAQMTREEMDNNFGPGRTTYVPDFSSPEFADIDDQAVSEPSTKTKTTTAAPVNAKDLDFDALIASFVADDKLRMQQEGTSGQQTESSSGENSKQQSVA